MKDKPKAKGEATAEKQREIQREQDRKDPEAKAKQGAGEKQDKAPQTGARAQPEPPLDEPHHVKPGIEQHMQIKPRFDAPDYKGSGKLEGMAAIITGGDSGIGRSVAVLYAREGADVAIVYLTAQEDAEETKRCVEKEGRKCLLIKGDVKDSKFCTDSVEKTVKEFGHLDILVNNAAFQEHAKSIADITDERLEETFRTNIFGYFYMARAALRHMKEGAAIVNTGSVAGLEGPGKLPDYAATKGAIHTFTKSLASSLIDRKIRVNCVAPGPIWTPLNASARTPDDMAQYGGDVPMGRPGQPEELAPAYVFFAAEACSSYISGEVLAVYGGKTTA
jgi:NAD(P)-dependent dehydrogenase (short-subunit alcohol dehydrogenase family)